VELPRIGPLDPGFWRSPLRGPWLASFLSSALLPLILLCAATGFISHSAYQSELGSNELFNGRFDLWPGGWPTNPAWLYAATQGAHVISGVAAIPILLAKLWAVIPKLYENPPVRSIAHGIERLSLALLVGGSLFVFFTGVLNIQLFYPWDFSFVPAHYWGGVVFLAALAFHITTKLPVVVRSFRERGVLRPLRDDLAHTEPEPVLHGEHTSAPVAPAAPTITRRAMLGTVGAASAGLAVMTAGQVVGGPLRDLALLAPRGRGAIGDGPNDFPVNKTFSVANIPRELVGPGWRLRLFAGDEVKATRLLSREDLLGLDLVTAELPIACVEGWSTTQEWTGVRLAELARLAGATEPGEVEVRSMQPAGAFRRTTLARNQIEDERSLIALRVNGADLSLDHGFPARLIVPALPGVHNTKWVGKLIFREVA
jgi:DMSO/TMAO reductase YedYZ molybdopterin-dependent catalytic subunit